MSSSNKSPFLIFVLICILAHAYVEAQILRLPDSDVNYACEVGRRIGLTDINIHWNAPGVKGREGKIWGTNVAYYGYSVLGYGSSVPSPWRAGANENTTIRFSTDVQINSKPLAAGTYGFFIALYPDSCVLIFNQNTEGWGSYFYNDKKDVLHVAVKQQKDRPTSQERLTYTFSNQQPDAVDVALEWERWRIPFTVSIDLKETTLQSIRTQLSGAMGFDPPSLEAAATWCLRNDCNYTEALDWITRASDPNLGAKRNFQTLSTRAGLLKKLHRDAEADQLMKEGLSLATVLEMHNYGRQLLSEQKTDAAMDVFQQNYKQNKGIWPTNAGLMRGYSAKGDLKKALEYAKAALSQAPNEESKRIIEKAVETLSAGKPL